MSKLRKVGDELRLKLSGLDSDEFKEALQLSKAVPGRVWDPEAKESVYPFNAENAMRLASTIRVQPDAAVQEAISERADEIAKEIAARAPDDSTLRVPYADQLFPFQRGGIEFMVTNRATLNADELGLGKTVQGLGTVHEASLREILPPEPRGLIIANRTVKKHWASTVEVGPRDRNRKPIFKNWIPSEATILDGSTAKRRGTQLENAHPYVVVNWEQLRGEKDGPRLRAQNWDFVIADAVSRAKNRQAQQTKALHKIKAPVLIGIDGAPIWNDPADLWGPLHWLDRESFPSYWAFYHTYVMYYEGFYERVVTGVRNPDALRFALRKKLIRRTMPQVLPQMPKKLPPKTIEVELYPVQQKLYKQAEQELWLAVEQAVEENPDMDLERLGDIVERGDMRELFVMIPNAGAAQIRMRQIVSTPALLGGPDKSVKLDTAQELIMRHADKQFVVFTHFRGTTQIMAERLQRESKNPMEAVWMHGETPDDERDRAQELFQAGDARVFVSTIRAGGEGIDLYAADTGIFIERDWTPTPNIQAEGRYHRIGQTNDTTTIIIDALDTVDVSRVRPTNRLKQMIGTAIIGKDK
jgi:SNF2 family DNA or RNA helicase